MSPPLVLQVMSLEDLARMANPNIVVPGQKRANQRVVHLDDGLFQLPRSVGVQQHKVNFSEGLVTLDINLRAFSVHSKCRRNVRGDFEADTRSQMGHAQFMSVKGITMGTILKMR